MSCIQGGYLHYYPYEWFFPFSIPNSSRDTTRIFCQHEVKWFNSIQFSYHCVKCIPIRSFSSLCFPAFGLNTERYGVSLRIQSECWKIGTRNFPNTDIFHAVYRTVTSTYCILNITISIYSTLYTPVPQNGQAHSNNSSTISEEMFECFCPFCGLGA